MAKKFEVENFIRSQKTSLMMEQFRWLQRMDHIKLAFRWIPIATGTWTSADNLWRICLAFAKSQNKLGWKRFWRFYHTLPVSVDQKSLEYPQAWLFLHLWGPSLWSPSSWIWFFLLPKWHFSCCCLCLPCLNALLFWEESMPYLHHAIPTPCHVYRQL